MADFYKAIKEKKKVPVLKGNILALLKEVLKSDEVKGKPELAHKIAMLYSRTEILLKDT